MVKPDTERKMGISRPGLKSPLCPPVATAAELAVVFIPPVGRAIHFLSSVVTGADFREKKGRGVNEWSGWGGEGDWTDSQIEMKQPPQRLLAHSLQICL